MPRADTHASPPPPRTADVSLGLALGLVAAAGYGVSDLLGGLAGRRVGTLPVLLVGQTAGLVVLTAAALSVSAVAPSSTDLGWSVVAGIGASGGGALLVRGMQVGRVGVVAPVSSVTGAGVPVLLEVATGAGLGAAAVAGSAVGLIAIWLVGGGTDRSAGSDVGRGAPGLGHGLGAGMGFAVLYLGLGQTDPATGAWPVVATQVVLVAVAAGAVALRRREVRLSGRVLTTVVTYGVLGALATFAYVLAARAGAVGVAALIASMSPAVTVLLARFALAEGLTPRRVIGLVAGLLALVLLDLD